MEELEFYPFYERLADRIGCGFYGKLGLSVAAGAAFFVPYFVIAGTAAFHDWSWLLAVLISFALGFLYFSTATLQRLLQRRNPDVDEAGADRYMVPLTRTLSDPRFLLAGVFTGCLNMLMGLYFGVPPADPLATGLLFFGFFLAGFFCGLPAYGIYGVLVAVNAFVQNAESDLDYTAPDRCGGMSYVGEALVKFSVVTLLEGCLIAAYILRVDWTNAGNEWVLLVMWFWIILPFLFSLLVLLGPAAKLNQMLINYRHSEERSLKIRCAELRKQIEVSGIEDEQLDKLHKEYEYLTQRREDVHRMRTWPFSTGASTSFAGTFIANLLLASELAKKLME